MKAVWEKYKQKIIGLGEQSSRKSYYPELQEKIDDLEASQRNLETIIHSISDSIIIHDIEGNILALNNQAQKIFNIKDEDKEFYTIRDIVSDKLEVSSLKALWDKVINGNAHVTEWFMQPLKTEEEIFMQISYNHTLWNGVHVLVGVFRDFSERKKYEQELIIARKKAEESDRLKTAFLANLSHEIRTPMNAIMGFTSFLKRQDLPIDKRETYASIVQKSGEQLLSIIDDIIEISKIETGQITPNYASVNINNMVNDLYKALKVTISEDQNIYLLLKETNPKHPVLAMSDKVKLHQVLNNLITNAIKYTEEGQVTIGFNIVNHGEELEFSVEDTGEGIESKYHDIIFDRFSRLESDLSMKSGGSGLGLAISKAYVEMLGGKMHLESEIGKGSLFSFRVPMIKAKEVLESDHIDPQGDHISGNHELILIAEDDDTNYLYFSKVLQPKNYALLRAKNGKEAVDLVSLNHDIKLVLMDIKMPVMNGFEAFKMIRQLKPDLPVVAQTAHTLPDDERQICEAGFHGYLTKPINEKKLLKTIRKLVLS